MGDHLSAHSGSAGADRRSDLGHSHRQRAGRWTIPGHNSEWRSPLLS